MEKKTYLDYYLDNEEEREKKKKNPKKKKYKFGKTQGRHIII